MKIENNNIILQNREICFGITFDDVFTRIQDYIYSQMEPDKNGMGHIIIKRQDFYGFKGTVTFYFQNNVLQRIGIALDWGMYNLEDKNGEMLPIDVAVLNIKNDCEKNFQTFCDIVESSQYGNTVFRINNIYITSSLSREGDNYSLSIIKIES